MKKTTILIIYFFIANHLLSQNLYDNQWILGANSNYDSVNVITWKGKEPEIEEKKRSKFTIGFDMASICDKAGKLKYFSYGCSILSHEANNWLPNAKDINKGYIYNAYCENAAGNYPSYNAMTFVPMPNDSNKYVYFHESLEKDSSKFYPPRKLNYTIIDATLNNGIGDATQKNETILYNRLDNVGIRACKHGNGRDWWILTPQLGFHGYYTHLLSPQGISPPNFQLLNKDSLSESSYIGQSVFSPDGSTYVRADPVNGVMVMKFDRCNGKLSNLTTVVDTFPYVCTGVAISPNSRFLYVSRGDVLLQYDLQAKDIQESMVLIATYDGFTSPTVNTETDFYKCQLAPNGKIYMGSTNSMEYLHVINDPDQKGELCNFEQHGFLLKRRFYIALPNIPNYNLGPKIGSPCEKSLSVKEEKYVANTIMVYPNPASSILNINLTEWYISLAVYDINGKLLKNIAVNNYQSDYQLDVSDFTAGVYLISGIAENGKKIGAQRFMIQ
jgi:hypothetical protein